MKFRIVGMVLFAVFVLGALPTGADAQGIGRRSQVLQQAVPIAPEPVSQVEILRDDIIRATNPVTGALDARQLRKPPSSRPTLGGVAPGVVGADRPPSSRPDIGGVAPGVAGVDKPPSSRPDSGGLAPD